MSASDQYSLNWSNHTAHVKKAFDSLLASNEFTDVTLACEGKKISAHKMLLSACSTYFHDLFKENPCQHPIVILKDVKYQHLLDILKFIYNGEVSVSIDTFETFLRTAEVLQISGLTDDDNQFTSERDLTLETPPKQVSMEPIAPVAESRLAKRQDVIEKSVTRKSDHVEWKSSEKVVQSPVVQKKRKSNSVVRELVVPKKEKREVSVSEDDEPIIITKQDPDTDTAETDNDEFRLASQQTFGDVDDLLPGQSKYHKLEERVGQLEAGRSFCKGCFLRTRLGLITKDRIKRVNTFCPGCDGLPNFCKECFKTQHKGMK